MEFRKAVQVDLPSIIQLLADDELGINREHFETSVPQSYITAFENIEKQEGNMVIVAVDKETIVGCLQLTVIPCLTHMGTSRAQIEGVRVNKSLRSKGIGESLIRYAIELARHNGCGIVQLDSHKSRMAAHRFYERIGFISSHIGMKLILDIDSPE